MVQKQKEGLTAVKRRHPVPMTFQTVLLCLGPTSPATPFTSLGVGRYSRQDSLGDKLLRKTLPWTRMLDHFPFQSIHFNVITDSKPDGACFTYKE